MATPSPLSQKECDLQLKKLHSGKHTLSEDEVAQLSFSIVHNTNLLSEELRRKKSYVSQDLSLGTVHSFPEPPDRPARNAVLEHFNPTIQRLAFQFVKSDARIETAMGASVPWVDIQYMKRKLFAYQLYGAFWLLLNERKGMSGAILADSMGLGKTTTSMLCIVLDIFLVLNKAHRIEYPEQHCGKTSSSTDMCPSWSEFPIECGCQKSSVIQQLELDSIPGTSLILVPSALVTNWIQEWHALGIDPSCGISLYVQHRDFPSHRLSQSHWHDLTLQLDNNTPTNSLAASKTIVVTTIGSYKAHVRDELMRQPRNHRRLALARVLRDEAHLTTSPETEFFSILEALTRTPWHKPNFLALTGTPIMRCGFKDMRTMIKMINVVSEGSANPHRVEKFMTEAVLDGIEADWNRYANGKLSQSDARKFRAKFVFLLYTYCIRRHVYSFQNGRRLAEIPPLQTVDLRCSSEMQEVAGSLRDIGFQSASPDPKLTDLFARRSRQSVTPVMLPTRALLNSIGRSRIFSVAPSLAILCNPNLEQPPLLTWKYVYANDWHRNPDESFFNQNLDRLERTSGKFQALRNFINNWKDCRDWRGQPEALVVLSEVPLICHIVICLLRSMGIQCAWMHAELSPTEKQELVTQFQNGHKGRSEDRLRVLVGTSDIMGQGVTLTAAHRLVFMEVSSHASVEAQGSDRVHRLGSVTDMCRVYRLINRDSDWELDLIEEHDEQLKRQTSIEWERSLHPRYPNFELRVQAALPPPVEQHSDFEMEDVD